MNFEEKYLQNSLTLTNPGRFEGKKTVAWRSPSNIALIKYWGKRNFQLPQNPSLSFTLDKSYTETKIEYSFQDKNRVSFDFKFEDKSYPEFEKKTASFLERLTAFLPFVKSLHLSVSSMNSFPHSAGIASSASSFSALALCLLNIENDLFGTLSDEKAFFEKASFMARLGSGSASRSVYPDFAVWGKNEKIEGSSDEIAVPYKLKVDTIFEELQDSILITSDEKKKISSTMGHSLMNAHPFATARYEQAVNNLGDLIKAFKAGDEQSFINIVENEAMTLHALMMSSKPGFSLLNDNTWMIISKVREYREKQGLLLTFTLDAGPNVHVIYPLKYDQQIKSFIKSDLLKYCIANKWIDDKMGSGPVKID